MNLRPAVVTATKASSFAAASGECTCYLRWIPAPSCSTIVVAASYVVIITDSSF